MSNIEQFPPTAHISLALQRRSNKRLQQYSDDEIFAYLADTIYKERRRIEEQGQRDAPPVYLKALQTASRAIKRDRNAMTTSLMKLVDVYTQEIHNHFSPSTYKIASKVLPGALARLLTSAQPSQLLGVDFDPGSRIVMQGPVDKLRKLAKNHTLLYTPTHLSNLDSPLIGYALMAAKLPPVIYGAGLNLFSNPLMSFFMSRLGAYTVDRRKKNLLYKDVLKDYSIESFQRGFHTLFFPGGTRARSGKIESKLKKGLLGTAITAWQESLQAGQNKELLVVPCSLSFSLTLEAETLINDALSEEGKSRFIISDDEFSEARTVASFTRKTLNLDASVFLRFGEPLDVVGNQVDAQGSSVDPHGAPINRRDYVCNRYGQVALDPQRDQMYTHRLAERIITSFRANHIALSTQVAAFAAWQMLCRRHPLLDDVQRSALRPDERRLPRIELLQTIERIAKQIKKLQKNNQICSALPGNAANILQDALQRFAGFHRSRCLAVRGDQIEVGSKLALYYGNRLTGYGLEELTR